MKVKVKLDQKTIQEFLLQNVEKIVLGIVVLVALTMLYFAFTKVERFGRTPEQLQQAVRTGRDEINRTPPKSGLVISNYLNQSERSRVHAVEEEPYMPIALWDPPIFSKRPLRDVPPLFGVQKLRVAAGTGTFRSTSEGSSATPRRRSGAAAAAQTADRGSVRAQRWVVVTGLVPVEKQETAYLETFKPTDSYDPERDHPVYRSYLVERVEVADATEAAEPDWTKAITIASDKALQAAKKDGMVTSDDVVAREYIDPKFTFPLGPRIGHKWGPEVAHEKKIPLQSGDDRDRDARTPDGMPGRPGDGFSGPMGAMNPGRMPSVDADQSTSDDAQPNRREAADAKRAPTYQLFRFFDYSVEPNKQYAYRVRMVLRNPNYKVKISLLKKPELANDRELKTNWSEASPVVLVPRDTRILASSVSPSVRITVEPSCKILIAKWLLNKGIEAFVEKAKISRGQLADFSNETFHPSGAEGSHEIQVDYITGAIVVDFRGGDRLPGPRNSALNSAGEILVLDPDGNLVVHNELDDAPAYDDLNSAKDETPRDEPGPGGAIRMPGFPGGPHGLDMFEDNQAPKKRPAAKK
jgi:hypothetical protein